METKLDIRVRCPECDRPVLQADSVPESEHLGLVAGLVGAEVDCPACGPVVIPDDEASVEKLVDRRVIN